MRFEYPVRHGNYYNIWIDRDNYFQKIFDAISHATRSVYVELYLAESGHLIKKFISSVKAARNNGAQVYILFDAFGTLGIKESERVQITKTGAHLHYFNSLKYGSIVRNFYRNHRKLVIIDETTAWIGGAGLADVFQPEYATGRAWHDMMIETKGIIVHDLKMAFKQVWEESGGEKLNQSIQQPPLPPKEAIESQESSRLLIQRPYHREIQAELIKRIQKAVDKVWISVPYFIPTLRMRRAIAHAALRHTDVKLILPGRYIDHAFSRYAAQRYYNYYLRSGVKIYEYQKTFSHLKLFICDDWISIGSANLDHWTLHWNLEMNIGIDNPPCYSDFISLFSNDLANSKNISHDRWIERSILERIREWIWGGLSQQLAKHSYRQSLRRPGEYPPFSKRG